jgi:hypothetical protein
VSRPTPDATRALGALGGLAPLLIDAAVHPQIADWFIAWEGLLPRALAGETRSVLFSSRFGTLFYARPDGTCHMLDVFFGEVQEIAPDAGTLGQFLSEPSWLETYLLAASVRALAAAGVVASGTECYAIAPHPAVGGPDPWAEPVLSPASIMVLEGARWQEQCVAFLRRARESR